MESDNMNHPIKEEEHQEVIQHQEQQGVPVEQQQFEEVRIANVEREELHQHQYSNSNRRQPDFGVDFIPNTTVMSHNNTAPKSLDHYQRGYDDRTIHRDRDPIDQQYNNNNGGGGSNYLSQQQQHSVPPPTNPRNNYNNPHSSSGSMSDRYNNNNNMYRGGSGNDYNSNRGNINNNNNHYNSNPGGRGNYYDRGDRNSNYHPGNTNMNNKGNDHHHHHPRSNYNNNGGDRPRFTNNNHQPHHGSNNDDPWNQQNHRDNRPTILQGLDINALADRLTTKLNNKHALFSDLDRTRMENRNVFDSGKALTALISIAARRKNIGLGHAAWDWMDHAKISKNTFHYNSMISVTEKARDYQLALNLLQEMKDRNIKKNEVTFSSAISACEKCGMWQKAIHLLDTMVDEGVPRTAIAFNATISACEKGMVPQKACEVFHRMKREGIAPSVVSYSALISAAEKGGQWRLALEILEEMKAEGFRGNVVAYSAAISALAKGQQWRKALQLFREIQSQRGTPSIVTYNATMTALEKGMEWERALDLFEEMKMNNLPITVVSYGSAISACDKGFQFRQCLEFLDEMTEMGIPKNVIIFGAAMSCMEKCSRADIGFQLMKRMKEEGIQPNVHIYNSAISACARSNLWEKGYELYEEMDREGVKRDVVTFNAVLDAVCSQIQLGRRLFKVGVERGFYAKVSRLGEQWLELDLHFLSLGGGEIALGWWFEECLVPYLNDTDKLANVKSISIVTGYGKTRTRGRRHGDDGMRKRCRAMLRYMGIMEQEQPNLGRIHIDKDSLIELVKNNGGRIMFDLDSYNSWKEEETIANALPDVEQKIRARFKPTIPGSGGPPFTRVESEYTTDEYRLEHHEARMAKIRELDLLNDSELRGDTDFSARDSDPQHGLRDSTGRGVAVHNAGSRDLPFNERNPQRSDQDRFGGPGDRGLVIENHSSMGRIGDEVPPFVDPHVREQPFRDRYEDRDQRSTSQFRQGHATDRESDVNFHRGNQTDRAEQDSSNFSDQRYRQNVPRAELNRDYDQRIGDRIDYHDRGQSEHLYDKINTSNFRGESRDYSANYVQGPPTSQSGPVHRLPVAYDERSMHAHDNRSDGRGSGFLDSDLRNPNLDSGFRNDQGGNWRGNEPLSNRRAQSDFGPDIDIGGRRGEVDERTYNDKNTQRYENQMHNRQHEDGLYLDGSQMNDHQVPGAFASRDNYGINEQGRHHHDVAAQVGDEDLARKRQYNDDSNRFGLQQSASSNSRGYTLEPETQRRRLS